MEPARPVTARIGAGSKRARKLVKRRLFLELFELEPESGEDECIPIDLGLDQVEE